MLTVPGTGGRRSNPWRQAIAHAIVTSGGPQMSGSSTDEVHPKAPAPRIVVVQDQTPCDRELTRLHGVPVDMHRGRVLNVAPRQHADRRGAEAETHRRAIGGIALKVPV